ncbi:protoporphyrinogen oxidase domain protein, partial [Chlamydia psittaci 84-8471/1]
FSCYKDRVFPIPGCRIHYTRNILRRSSNIYGGHVSTSFSY